MAKQERKFGIASFTVDEESHKQVQEISAILGWTRTHVARYLVMKGLPELYARMDKIRAIMEGADFELINKK